MYLQLKRISGENVRKPTNARRQSRCRIVPFEMNLVFFTLVSEPCLQFSDRLGPRYTDGESVLAPIASGMTCIERRTSSLLAARRSTICTPETQMPILNRPRFSASSLQNVSRTRTQQLRNHPGTIDHLNHFRHKLQQYRIPKWSPGGSRSVPEIHSVPLVLLQRRTLPSHNSLQNPNNQHYLHQLPVARAVFLTTSCLDPHLLA